MAEIQSPVAPSEPSKLDEILLQDLLSERAEIRASIEVAGRYLGLALVLIIGAAVHADALAVASIPHAKRFPYLGNVGVLITLLAIAYSFYVDHLQKRLAGNIENLNARLKVWNESVNEIAITGLWRVLKYITLVIFMLLGVCWVVLGFFR